MSPEFKNPFEQRIGKAVQVTLDEKSKYFPATFTVNTGTSNQPLLTTFRVITVQSATTEVARNWKGSPKAEIFNVSTKTGYYQLRHTLSDNSWMLVGKLKE